MNMALAGDQRRRGNRRARHKAPGYVRCWWSPTACNSATALMVGANATTRQPASTKPRLNSCSVAVLPVPAEFLIRVVVHPWDSAAAQEYGRIRQSCSSLTRAAA
jgi:hypothetical protein